MKTDVKTKFLLCFIGAAATAWIIPRFPVQTAQANDRIATDVAARVRPLGLAVIGQPLRQGEVYIVDAQDPRGAEMRVLVDARTGSVVSIGPSPTVATYSYSPHYDASPRIITIAPVDDEDATPARRTNSQRDTVRQPVRQVVPSRDRPRDTYAPVETKAVTPAVPTPRERQANVRPDKSQTLRQEAREAEAERQRIRYEEIKREEIRRAIELERRQTATAPAVTTIAPAATAPAVTAPPVTTPRVRPRTVLAPPPYADPSADRGPSPLKPLQHPDAKRFAPAADQPAEEAPPPPPEDTLRSEARAGVPQVLPQIPQPPRAAVSAVPETEAKEEPKPAEAAPLAPEDTPPPGDAVGDFTKQP